MTRKIFKNILAVSVAVLLICSVCISFVLYGYFGNIIRGELKNEAELIASGLEDDADYLEKMNNPRNRITLIADDGTVLFDSRADAALMENHKSRTEVKEAKNDGEGYSTRHSDTLNTNTIYYAKELKDGSVLRIAQDESAVMMMLKGMAGPALLIILAVIIIAAILSRRISVKIIEPVNEMDPADPDADEPYAELAPLVTKIRQQNSRIAEQMAQMERRQKEFATITDNMSEGFLLIDLNMEILSYNEAAVRLLGDRDTIKPHTAFELNRSRAFRSAVEKALAGENNQQPMESEDRFYNIIANPVAEDGKTAGAVVLVVDVTEKEQRDKLRREFTSNVSHELKTPLTTIYGVSDMMTEGIVKPADIKSFSRNIREESGRMITLINDIIRLSQLDEGSFTDETVRVNLLDTAKNVVSRLNQKAQDANVRLYIEGDPAVIDGIPHLCDEIIYNLCENAIKYNKDGGSVTVSIRETRENVILEVEDTGEGMPPGYEERIFERFYRIDKSRNRSIEGTGLGLSIVKHAVLHMGGNIEVDSLEGVGTKMIVTFPRRKEN